MTIWMCCFVKDLLEPQPIFKARLPFLFDILYFQVLCWESGQLCLLQVASPRCGSCWGLSFWLNSSCSGFSFPVCAFCDPSAHPTLFSHVTFQSLYGFNVDVEVWDPSGFYFLFIVRGRDQSLPSCECSVDPAPIQKPTFSYHAAVGTVRVPSATALSLSFLAPLPSLSNALVLCCLVICWCSFPKFVLIPQNCLWYFWLFSFLLKFWN